MRVYPDWLGFTHAERDTACAVSIENVEVVKQSLDAYNRRDFDAMRTVSDPDLEVDWSASRGPEVGVYRGMEEVLRFYRNFFDAFEKSEIEPLDFIESGDSVVVPNTAHMRGRDGIEIVARSAFVFETHGGRVTRIRLYQETQEALEASG
jgi:ketosteroid isomerase-like protein